MVVLDTTFLTIDGSAAGEATFNAGIVIADAGTIGSASDKDAIAIASDGVVTFSQIPVFLLTLSTVITMLMEVLILPTLQITKLHLRRCWTC